MENTGSNDQQFHLNSSKNNLLSSKELLKNYTVLRKLGFAEAIYDYEHSNGNVILGQAFKISSKFDLFENIDKTNEAIYYWKQMHSLLRARILTVQTNEKYCSSEKYFAYSTDEVITSNDNVKYFRLNDINNNEVDEEFDKYWNVFYDREYNIQFVDTVNGPLWRLVFVKSKYDESNQEFIYYLLLTIHHGIADARNGYTMILNLLEIIEKVYLNQFQFVPNSTLYDHFEPSIEEKLFQNDPKKLSEINIKIDPNYTESNKVPEIFARKHQYASKGINSELTITSNDGQIMSFNTLLEDCQTKYNCRTNCFVIKEEKLKQLLTKCKLANAKLTGCLNIITAIATSQLYVHYKCDPNLLKIQYHVLANLRPFLDPPIDNNIIGYWAIVLNFLVELQNFEDNDPDWHKKVWELAKRESDLIHEKIKNKEIFEAAKVDSLLIKDINAGVKFENGGVHFALSNLGMVSSASRHQNAIKIKEHYFGTALQRNRWSTVVFHGLTTIDNNLCWCITYNTELVSEQVISFLQQLIVSIVDKLIKNVPNKL